MPNAPRHFRFCGFLLDTRTRELRDADGVPVHLTAKAFDTLCCLVAHRDRVVGKDELLATVWAGRVVEENNLTQAVSALRRALGSGRGDARCIVTVPGRGYRFVAEVEEGDGAGGMPEAAPPTASAPAAARSASITRRAVASGALLFALALFAIVAWRLSGPARPQPAAGPPITLAVLPFRSLSAGPRDELLELGLADTLVTRLGRAGRLRVRSLASSQRLAAREPDPLADGRALGAAYVVEGSSQRIGDRVRVNARLLSVRDGTSLWAGTFDADHDRAFTLQDRIGEAVTAALALQPPRAGQAPAACEGTDEQAYRALLRAQYTLHRRGPGMVAGFQEAIRRDPACARAYAGLATAYLAMAHHDGAPATVFPLARAAAAQALRIDPASAEAHLARGRYLQLHAWDWPGAEAELRRALALNPSLPDAHFALAHLLVATGRFDEGLAQGEQARALDPLSPLGHALQGGFLGAAGRPAQAREQLARALQLEPGFWIALQIRGAMALDRGEPAAAVADLEQAAAQSGRTSQVLAVLAAAYVAAGERARAEAILAELRQRGRTGYVPPVNLAAVHLALGQRAQALDALERAYRAHDIRMAFLGIDARWNPLRDEPRFRALARALRLNAEPARGRY